MNETMPVIRQCRVEDIEAVLRFWRQAGAMPSATDTAADLERVLEGKSAVVLLAEHENQVIGSVIGGFDGWRGNIYRLVVHPAFRRRGIARELVAAVEQRLAEMGAKRITALVVVDHLWAMGFWSAVGYRHDEHMARLVRQI
jgi:ribosomal protein S18 acetylase RimI-like enzyme